MRRIRELDGLRAVAIFLVLGCHYEGFSQLAWRLPELGWVGVDLFFCLSGYLITSILFGLRGRATPYKTFYSRRLIRILPPYAVVIALVIAFYAAHRQAISAKWMGIQLLFLQAFSVQQARAVWDVLTHLPWHLQHLPPLLSGGYSLPLEQTGAPLTIVIVPFILWSLSIEEYFYLLWAPIVLRLSMKAIVSFGVTICIVETMLRWTLASSEVYYGIAYRFDALIYGGFLAILFERWRKLSTPRSAQRILAMVFGTAALCLAAMLFHISPVLGNDPRASPLVLVLGLPLLSVMFAALIGMLILRSDSSWWLSRLLCTRIMQFVGKISYTMYLFHLVAAAVIRYLIGSTDVFHQTFVQAVMATAVTIGIAQVSWLFLEKKLLRWKDIHFPNDPPPPEPIG